MDETTFECALAAQPAPRLRRLTRRFNYAFRQSRDLDVAMAAVNEFLHEPISYREFLSILRD